MEEKGVVSKTGKNFAVVRVDRRSECDKCGMCVFPKGAGFTEFYANNILGAKVGDTVMIKTSDNAKALGIILVFLVPLLLIGVSALITFTLIKEEIFVLILSLGFCAVWFTVLALLDKKLKKLKAFSTEITEITEKKES